MIGAAALLLIGCVAVPGPVPGIVNDPADPYYYSRSYCEGRWLYGKWGGARVTTEAAGVHGSVRTPRRTITEPTRGATSGTKGTGETALLIIPRTPQ